MEKPEQPYVPGPPAQQPAPAPAPAAMSHPPVPPQQQQQQHHQAGAGAAPQPQRAQPRAAAAVNAAGSSTCSLRCFVRGAILVNVLVGSLFMLILLCRMAELTATSSSASPTSQGAFWNFNFWITLFAAPVASAFAFRRVHHASLPWFHLAIACVAYLVLIQYTGPVGAMRQNCATSVADDSSVARRNCNMQNLGFVGAFLVFTAQLIAFWLTSFCESTTVPTWDEILCLFHSVMGSIFARPDVPQLEHKWDLFFRIVQLVFAWCGALFWLIEMAYFSNQMASAISPPLPLVSVLPFADWYTWVVVFGCPILVAISFRTQVHHAVPFIATIATFIVFYDTTIITPPTAQCVAFVGDYSQQGSTTPAQDAISDNCNFLFVGFVGVLLLWFSMLFFVGLVAGDVFARAAEQAAASEQAEDSRNVKSLRAISIVFVIVGCCLWIILLGKSAQYIAYTNSNNITCTSKSLLNCLHWFEWYWWQLIFIAPVIAILASLRTPRSAPPFYAALVAAIMFYASKFYSQVQTQGFSQSSQVPYIFGVQGCRGILTDGAGIPTDDIRFCEMQSVGYCGIIMIIVGMAISIYLSGSRLPTRRGRGLPSSAV